ncbi:hypothetical protein B0H14DRAFT_2617876 [Mycena olivaceomarginata]|nr:hypothetical protein B0H14DRAFT_2617876 [Mycena olivaceomarginata]
MPAGRPLLDPEIKWQRHQESLKCYAANVRAKIAEMDWKERKQHCVRVAEDSEWYRDRRDQKEREEQESKQAVKTKQRHIERDVLRMAHGLPPIPPSQPNSHTPHQDQSIRPPRKNRPPRADKGMKDWKYLCHPQCATTPPGPKNNPTRATSDDSNDNSSTHRAATPPIYEGGMTASTCAAAPVKCPECDCEDREAHTGGFFAVIHGNWKGAVTSQFLDLWTLDCSEYHEHEYETPEVRARAALRVRQHLRGVAHYERLVAADKEIRVEEEAKRAEEEGKRAEEEGKQIKREEMEYLAATHSSESATLAKKCVEHAFPSDDRPSPTATTLQASLITPPQTPARIAASNDYTPTPTTRLSGLPAYIGVQEFEMRQAPALYAVHVNGHNRVFNNRARTVEVFKDTPGGELVFVGDEQNLWHLLDDQ